MAGPNSASHGKCIDMPVLWRAIVRVGRRIFVHVPSSSWVTAITYSNVFISEYCRVYMDAFFSHLDVLNWWPNFLTVLLRVWSQPPHFHPWQRRHPRFCQHGWLCTDPKWCRHLLCYSLPRNHSLSQLNNPTPEIYVIPIPLQSRRPGHSIHILKWKLAPIARRAFEVSWWRPSKESMMVCLANRSHVWH